MAEKTPDHATLKKKVRELEKQLLEYQQAEKVMKLSQFTVEQAADSVLWVKADAGIFYVNDAACRNLGYSRHELCSLKITDINPDFPPHRWSPHWEELGRKRSLVLKSRHRRKDGSIFPVELMINRIAFGGVDYHCTFARNTSEREHAEAILKKSEATLKSLLRAAPIGMGLVSYPERTLGWINEQLCRMTGYTHEDLAGKNARILYENDAEYQRVAREKHPAVKKEGIGSIETRFKHKAGDIIDVFLSSSAIDPSDVSAGMVFTAMDITEGKRAEAALRKSEERFRAVIEDMPALICRFLPDGTLTFVNGNYCNYFNSAPDELIGQDFFQFIPEENRDIVGRKFRSLGKDSPMTTYEHNVLRPNGTIHWQEWIYRAIFNDQGHVMEYQALGRDITEFKIAAEEKEKIQTQLQQAKRFEAIGTLAGGIAHDFNNLLMGVQGNASLMLLETDPGHPHHEKLKNIERYVQDGSDLTKQLLGFARGGKYEIATTGLNALINASSRMFGRTKKEIRIHTKYQTRIWSVEVDRSQIEQVMLNLYVNAWQAMPGGGELYLETANTVLDKRFVRPFGLPAGKYVKISVTDTGIGMDEAIRQRIFDPFFTTKEKGRGTGLGLASAYGIIKNHKGIINVVSKKREGTTFDIYLPASEKKPKTENMAREEVLTGDETVLLVDDEELVIDVGKQMLEKMGYRALVARSGSETLEIYKGAQERIDMVILDMIMPDMNGGDTYDQLKAFDPNVKVLLSSGYSVSGEAEKILERGCNGFIQKPFKLKDLSQKVREILNQD